MPMIVLMLLAAQQTTTCMVAGQIVTCDQQPPLTQQQPRQVQRQLNDLVETTGQQSRIMQQAQCRALAKRAADAGNFDAAARILKGC